ncbi:MAG: hypothetical protein BWY85_01329 [Firmicutes bacterium ADurb.Bin506]|jgi:putative endonuclease|nr:MAG: hypothetical protein BWY85_01329 [Firmicutes bacterium ADurb.Bin506]
MVADGNAHLPSLAVARSGQCTKRAGELGEALAAKHLSASGYTILGRNLRLSGCEVDILARQGDTVVVVEVKTRLSAAFGHPIEQISQAKMLRLIRAARAAAAAWAGANTRIDVIGVTAKAMTGGMLHGVELTHVLNVSG